MSLQVLFNIYRIRSPSKKRIVSFLLNRGEKMRASDIIRELKLKRTDSYADFNDLVEAGILKATREDISHVYAKLYLQPHYRGIVTNLQRMNAENSALIRLLK